jgi:hypothetical protein
MDKHNGPYPRDLTGHVYGRLTVIEKAHRDRNGIPFWRCICKCGTEVFVRVSSLRTTRRPARSCGCLNRDAARSRLRKLVTTHGLSRAYPSEHISWISMRKRCSARAGKKDRRHYYDAGVRVCERWRSFAAFFEDLGPKPTPQHSLDRFPDRHGNYEPGNVRWATHLEQQGNKDRTRHIPFRGRVATLTEIANETGIRRSVLASRLNNDWSPERMISQPVAVIRRRVA